MTVIVTDFTDIRRFLPNRSDLAKTLIKYRGDYDKTKICIRRKLNTWDNPNANYIKKKDRS